ncbi:MAG: OmpA family protein [Acidimicrobiia bacterium]|nr:OmpA family protein [Acidimicrobiia bacterium]
MIVETETDDETYALFDAARFDDVLRVFHSSGGDFEVKLLEGGFFGVLERGIEFELARADLTGNSAIVLAGFRDLIQRTTVDVTIEGHTDSTGSEESNQLLSEARASAVASYFEQNGVDPARLVVIGHGESQPVAANNTPPGRAKNRRVTITMGFDDD